MAICVGLRWSGACLQGAWHPAVRGEQGRERVTHVRMGSLERSQGECWACSPETGLCRAVRLAGQGPSQRSWGICRSVVSVGQTAEKSSGSSAGKAAQWEGRPTGQGLSALAGALGWRWCAGSQGTASSRREESGRGAVGGSWPGMCAGALLHPGERGWVRVRVGLVAVPGRSFLFH